MSRVGFVGSPLGDWDPSLVSKLDGPGTAGIELSATLYLYYFMKDRGETAIAYEHLRRAMDAFGYATPSSLTAEAVYQAGFHLRNAALARQWFTWSKPEEIAPHVHLRAHAAVLFAEQQFHEAIAVAEQGLASLATVNNTGVIQAQRSWLEAIVEASRQAITEVPSGSLSTSDDGQLTATPPVTFEVTVTNTSPLQ